MTEFKIRFSKTKKPYPIIEFADSSYSPIGAFLLAERPIISEIINTLISQTEENEISGNVYTLTVNGESSTITNDIEETDLNFPTSELTKIAQAYKTALTAAKSKKRSEPKEN